MLADGFSLEFEWQQVSRTRLRILAVLSNAVIWIVSTRPPTSKSSRSFNNPLVIVPKAPITIGTIVTFMKEAVTKVIDTLTQEDFHGASQKLLERDKKCIATGGDYFEGD